jgi:hypothetical protein
MTNPFPEIGHFTGTEHWYRHNLNPRILYTDGARYIAMQAGAYWLLDEIALAQITLALTDEGFQVWRLVVKDNAATLTCEDGNRKILHTKRIAFTDFPASGITLYCTDNVILLPSEY